MIIYQLATYDHVEKQSTFEPISRDEEAARAHVARRAARLVEELGLEAYPDPEIYRRNRSVASISLAEPDGEYVLTYSLKGREQHCVTCTC